MMGGSSGSSGNGGSVNGGSAGNGGTAGSAGAGGGGNGGVAGGGSGGTAGTAGTAGSGGDGGAPFVPLKCVDVEATPECTCVDNADHAYLFCNPTVMQTFSQAADSCAFSDLRLVRIDSPTENNWLKGEAITQQVEYFWIGASSVETPGTWVWEDGDAFWQGDSMGEQVGDLYYQWRDGAPGSDTLPFCGYMGQSGWDFDTCSTSRDYVCESY